jgi:hypothetical protein
LFIHIKRRAGRRSTGEPYLTSADVCTARAAADSIALGGGQNRRQAGREVTAA